MFEYKNSLEKSGVFMRKYFNKFVAGILIIVLCMTVTVPALADTGELLEQRIEVTTEATTIQNEMMGLDQYMSYADNQTIVFDTVAALADGYAESIVENVNHNIMSMNSLVLSGEALPGENFTIVQQGNMRDSKITTIAGESKIVTHWDGRVEYYLSVAESRAFYQCLVVGYTLGEAASSALEIFGSYSAPLTAIGSIWLTYTVGMKQQLEIAYLHGTGLIMTTQNEPATGIMHIWFMAQ